MSVLAAAGISAASNLVGNLFGSNSQKKANEANLKINQMNNEFNAREAKKARDFTLDMFNRSNDWNSAKNQRARLEQAGLNPYMMMNGGSAGTATSSGASPAASASGSPQMQAFRPDFSGVIDAINSVYQNRLLGQQSRKTSAEADATPRLLDSITRFHKGNTNYLRLDPKFRDWERNQLALQIDTTTGKLEEERKNVAFSNQLIQAQTARANLDAAAQSIVNRYLNQDQQLGLDLKAAQYYGLLASRQLTEQQARESLAREIETYASANGKKISNDIARRTAESYIKANNYTNLYNANYNKYLNDSRNGKGAFLDAHFDRLKRGYEAENLRIDAKLKPYNSILNTGNSIGNFYNRTKRR